MKRAAVCSALLVAGIAGCSALRPDRGPTAEDRLAQGLALLHEQQFRQAQAVLEQVYRAHWQEEVGQKALLALTASELDSRNGDRRLWYAADLASRYLGIEAQARWTVPVAETLYLLAQELGAQEEELARAEADRRQAEAERAQAQRALRTAEGRGLPTSTRETVPARLRRISTERDELQRRLAAAEQRLATREKELRDAQQELERIRKTIK